MQKTSARLAVVLSLTLSAIAAQAADLGAMGNKNVASNNAPLTRAQVIDELKLAYGNREIPSLEVLYHFPSLDRPPVQTVQQHSSQGQPVAIVKPQEEPVSSTTR